MLDRAIYDIDLTQFQGYVDYVPADNAEQTRALKDFLSYDVYGHVRVLWKDIQIDNSYTTVKSILIITSKSLSDSCQPPTPEGKTTHPDLGKNFVTIEVQRNSLHEANVIIGTIKQALEDNHAAIMKANPTLIPYLHTRMEMEQYPNKTNEIDTQFTNAKETIRELIDLRKEPTPDLLTKLKKALKKERKRALEPEPKEKNDAAQNNSGAVEKSTQPDPKKEKENAEAEKKIDALTADVLIPQMNIIWVNKLRAHAKAMPGTSKGKVIGGLLLLVGAALCLGAVLFLAPHITLIGIGLFCGVTALGCGSLMGGIATALSRAKFSPMGRLLDNHASFFKNAPKVNAVAPSTEPAPLIPSIT